MRATTIVATVAGAAVGIAASFGHTAGIGAMVLMPALAMARNRLWVIKSLLAQVSRCFRPSGNDDEDRPAGMWTRFGTEMENGFRRLVRQECSCSGQYEFGLDGSKQGSRAQAGEDDIRSGE